MLALMWHNIRTGDPRPSEDGPRGAGAHDRLRLAAAGDRS
jgi:hypothetical protein